MQRGHRRKGKRKRRKEEGRQKGPQVNKMVHWENKTGILFKMCLRNQEKKSWGKEKKKKKKIKGRKGKISFQRNVCFASYNRKM